MNKKIHLLMLCYLIFSAYGIAQESRFETVRIISYNLENLFDCQDDSLTADESFTPQGEHQWTENKYWIKINNLSRAITAAGEWDIPILIGMCEVENAKVINDLFYRTQLKEWRYQFVHKDSPDPRGVDVALAYLPQKFHLIHEEFIPVHIEDGKATRDILYAKGTLPNQDTLHIFVNHWPSRYGGELESEGKRIIAAETLREKTDSLLSSNDHCKIIIMGDFNDYPDSKSINDGLCAISPQKNSIFDQLYNLSYSIHKDGMYGSHKFGGQWGMLDQMIVSGALLNSESTCFLESNKVNICQADFLLKKDATGTAPKRSFLGTFFAYGYSDHLPISINLIIKDTDIYEHNK